MNRGIEKLLGLAKRHGLMCDNVLRKASFLTSPKVITASSAIYGHLDYIPLINGKHPAGQPSTAFIHSTEPLARQHGTPKNEGTALPALAALPPSQGQLPLHVACPHVNEIETAKLAHKMKHQTKAFLDWTGVTCVAKRVVLRKSEMCYLRHRTNFDGHPDEIRPLRHPRH